MKANIQYSLALAGCLLVLLSACKTIDKSRERRNDFSQWGLQPFTLPESVFPPPDIQSLQLFPAGNINAPPVIKLNGSKKLVLSFDQLSKQTRQFKITISHRSQDWQKSPLPPTAYTSAFFKDYFGSGAPSFTANPEYIHYEYRFPNHRLNITKSGNYLLSVYASNSNKLLFRIPFFITENRGKIQTDTQLLFAQHTARGQVLQPFTRYRYPRFVVQPQFNLSVSYVPNQFWGQTRTIRNGFYAGNKLIQFRLPRNYAFAASSAINSIDLRQYPPAGPEVASFIAAQTPPLVILKKDKVPFSALTPFYHPVLVRSARDRQWRYMSVRFRLEPPANISPAGEIYVVGTFNHWSVDARYRMHLDPADSVWKTNILIKQGFYFYKYVSQKNGRIIPVSKITGLRNRWQYILTFVYYNDPQLHYDRLLKISKTPVL